MGGVQPFNCLNMFRPKHLRYRRISDSDSYDSQIQPLLVHNHNQLMEDEHAVQAFWEKVSELHKEIGDLKAKFSRLETKLQIKATDGNNQQEAIAGLEQEVDKLKKNLDKISFRCEAQKSMNSFETAKQGRTIRKIEEKNSKKVAELESKVNETTSSMVDIVSVLSELEYKYSSNHQGSPRRIADSENEPITICVLILVFIVGFIIGFNL